MVSDMRWLGLRQLQSCRDSEWSADYLYSAYIGSERKRCDGDGDFGDRWDQSCSGIDHDHGASGQDLCAREPAHRQKRRRRERKHGKVEERP